MKRMFWLCILLVLFASHIWADDSDGPVFGPNKLQNNSAVSTYVENPKGIPVYVEGLLSTQKTTGHEAEAAIAFFEENRGAYKMTSPADELKVARTDRDDLGMTHVRFAQNYKDVPVVGGVLIAHFVSTGQLKTVNGQYYHDINLDVIPAITPQDALARASDHLSSFFGEGTPNQPELVVFPWDNAYYLSWRLFLFSNTPMGRWEYFVDAKTGNIIYNANRIMNANDVGTGYGVLGGARSHIDTDLNGSTYQMRDYTRQLNNNPHGHNGQMPSGNYIQTNIAGGSLPGAIATDADNFWDEATAQRPAVDGHVYSALFYDWLLAQFGRNGYNNNGAAMLTSVNYNAEGDNNAYWNGQQIVIWSWSSGWRSLAGCPDVIAHEWGHAVTEYCSDLVYQKEPGALNESFSDMMGAAFEWAHPAYDTPDWGMGENGRTTGVPFRSMSDPHLYSDPDYYGTSDPYWIDVVNCTPSGYNDYCGVHTNSGVGNKWFFLLSDGGVHHGVTVTGIAVANSIKIAYRANDFYWTTNTDYHQAALGTISAANDLDPTGAWSIQVSNAWNAVGVSTPGPSLAFDYPDGVPSMVIPNQPKNFEVVISGTLGGTLVSGSGQIHYSLNGGAYISDPLTTITSTRFRATLPGTDCGDVYAYYISAEETTTGVKYDPDPSAPLQTIAADSIVVIFEDNFQTNKGWAVSGNAVDGMWERAVPANGGSRGDPPTDFDGSGSCYVTDNGIDADIDGGVTYLDSPVFDLSGGDARISYARWYSNDFGNMPHTDTMKVYISNNGGTNWTLAERIGPVDESSGGWYEHEFWAGDIVSLSSQMKLRFEASDFGDGSVVEAGLDAVKIMRYVCGSSPQPLQITTESLPDWTANYPISVQLTATGGVGTRQWLDKYGDLDGTGLSLSIEGLLSGTPTDAGAISFVAEVTDEASNADQQLYNFTINNAPGITTTTLPDWTAGLAYSQQLTATGGTGQKVWSDKFSNLSGTGLNLSATGLVSGTPIAAGQISFTAVVTDQVGATTEKAFNFVINPAISITTISLPDWTAAVPYSQQLAAAGGTGNKTWNDKFSSLIGTGLSLSSSGLLSGTPVSTGGSLKIFTARVADQVGAAAEHLFLFVINPSVAITSDSLPQAETGTPYSVQLQGSGGTGSKTWVDRDNSLAGSGLDLSAGGLLSGTPASAGDIALVIKVADAVGSQAEKPFTLSIVDPYVCGDANGDDAANLADAVYLISYIFKGGDAPAPIEAGDANCDSITNLADAVYLVNYVFNGGPAPCCP